MADLTGQQLGNYRLVRPLGSGGFAEVYLARHVTLDRQVAIKVLHSRPLDAELQKQFVAEARAVAGLAHLHIVRLFDVGLKPQPHLVMEYAARGTLRDLHPRGTLVTLDLVVQYVKQIASALQYAHDCRFIHRDVKPENMLVRSNGEVALSDFGIVTALQMTQATHVSEDYRGTPAYSAPEQLLGKPTRASDQYALGVVMYEWLSGQLPFQAATSAEMALNHLQKQPRPLSELVSIHPAVELVVMRALAKDPRDRFATVQTFADVLERAYASSQQVATLPPQSPAHPQAQAPTVPVKGQPPTLPRQVNIKTVPVTSRQSQWQPAPPALIVSAATDSSKAKIRRQKLTRIMEIVVAFVLGAAGTAVILGINNFLLAVEGNQIVYSWSGPTHRYGSIGTALAIAGAVFVLVYIAARNEYESSWLSLFLAGLTTEGVIWLIMLIGTPPPTVLDWQVLRALPQIT